MHPVRRQEGHWSRPLGHVTGLISTVSFSRHPCCSSREASVSLREVYEHVSGEGMWLCCSARNEQAQV